MSALDSLVAAAGRSLDPLRIALDDEEALEQLLAEIGWMAQVDEETLALVQSLLAVGDSLAELPATLAALQGSVPERAEALADLVVLTSDVMATIGRLGDLGAADVAELPRPLSAADTWGDIAVALPDHLLAAELERSAPALFSVLRLVGLVGAQATPYGERHRFRWEELGAIVADPMGALAGQAGWGTRLRTWPLVCELGAACSRTGAATGFRPLQDDVAAILAAATGSTPSGFECDVVLFRGRVASGATAQVGLVVAAASGSDGAIYIGNLMHGELAAPIPLAEPWQLVAAGEVDGTATVGALLRPTGLEAVTSAAELGLSVALVGAPSEPWTIIGGAVGPRMELAGVRFEVGLEGSTSDPNAYVALRIDDGDLRVVLDLGGADGFLRSVIGEGPTIALGGELRASTSAGLQLSGGVGLEATIPIDKDIGPVHVDTLCLAFGPAEAGARLSAIADMGFTVGPFTAQASGLGLSLDLIPGSIGQASLDASLAFVPPKGVGFELDLGDAGHGSGFVGYDPALGRYFGALELELVSVGLGAMVVIDTRLPDDPSGWALFASVFATFPSLPLGFGFFLSGVGGLACLNRTLDGDALASGLKSGAIDAILFPDNVLEELPLILSQLDAWFPLAEGSSVFGVAARITWGTPVTIITGQLGIALVLPELEIAVMGSVEMLLPTEDEVLLELHMDSLGVIDVPGGTVMVVASLYDSALLSTIHLSGDMAFYVSVGTSPYFLLSVGGYHPNFDPPCGLPASVLALDRMRAEIALSDDVFFALEAYVAVTANTLQFGSLATLVASAKFLLTTYTARGSVGFDVLLVFSPFSFSAAFQLSVSVSAGDKELLAVDLAARLDGPAPWYTSGYARFEFFGIGVRFDFEFGGPVQPETPAREDVCGLVVAALDAPAAWRAAQPAWADTTVLVFAPGDAEDAAELWVRPDAELEARQTVAPLDRSLDHFGVFAIDGPTTLAVTSAGIDGVAEGDDFVTITDWFAPAQYDELTRAEKLAAPSYEEMTTGVRFSAGGLGFDAAEATTVVPGYEVRILDDDATRTVDALPADASLAAATAALALDTARQPLPRTVSSATFVVGAPTWQTFDPATGAAAGSARSYREAQLALAAARAADPASRLWLAPTHAVEALA